MSNFYNTFNGKVLDDAGTYVSDDFKKFQIAMRHEVKRIAKEIGANLVSFAKGHYDMSWFVERDGHYVYCHYGVMGIRSKVMLDHNGAMFIRTAANEHDFRGGSNNFTSFTNIKNMMDRLLKREHRPC